MYNSDPGFYVENNWNKDPKFIVENNWDKDPGFFMPEKQGKDFLREYLSGREDYSQSGTDVPSFGISRNYEGGGGTGMEPYFNEQIAATPSFSIPQGQGALGRRSGEQLKRIQESGIQNEQLQQELERRGMMPRGIQLPPV
jgi:hypothetical protein